MRMRAINKGNDLRPKPLVGGYNLPKRHFRGGGPTRCLL